MTQPFCCFNQFKHSYLNMHILVFQNNKYIFEPETQFKKSKAGEILLSGMVNYGAASRVTLCEFQLQGIFNI